MSIIYEEGWKNARLAMFVADDYYPIACIVSLDEAHSPEFEEKTNVCTEGETVKTFKRLNSTISVNGEAVTENSYEDLYTAFMTGLDQTFKREGHSATAYFTAKITNLSRNNTAGEGSNFSMTLELDKNGFVAVNPK